MRLTLKIALAALVLTVLYFVSTSIWWTGTGYCLGSMAGCLG
jgi:hypothetical protein